MRLAAGTWGPETAQGLIAREGHSWPLPTQLAVTPKEQGDER